MEFGERQFEASEVMFQTLNKGGIFLICICYQATVPGNVRLQKGLCKRLVYGSI